jgi:tetratricopeptide (TPR) repeat protein
MEAVHEGDPKIATVRVYAGSGYRSQNVNWEVKFASQLDLASQILVPAFGVRLEVVDTKRWERTADGSDLEAMLSELEQLDPGEDVDWVIGLVTALPYASPSVHDLGMARPLGRHTILRGIDDAHDRKVVATAQIDEDQKPALLEARRQHKLTLVLLHEIAHTLGAMHADKPEWIMNGSYNKDQAEFSDENARLIRAMLPHRLTPADERIAGAEHKALLEYLEAHDWGGWDPDERAQTMQWLQDSGAADVDTTAGNSGAPVPREANTQYQRTKRLVEMGYVPEAREELESLVSAYPANFAIRALACQLEIVANGPTHEAVTEVCTTAANLSPTDPTIDMMLSATLLATGDRPASMEAAKRARARLDASPDDREDEWHAMALLYQSIGAVTWTEQALAAGGIEPRESPAGIWALQTRARYAVPVDGADYGITPETEPDYVDLVSSLLQLVYSEQFKEARKLAVKGLKTFPNGPGINGILCDLEVRKKRWDAARKRCKKAVAAFDGASWSQYLLGIIELRKRNNKAGIRHLERAIELDPDLHQAYRSLGKAYERVKNTEKLDALDKAYRDRFGQSLP